MRSSRRRPPHWLAVLVIALLEGTARAQAPTPQQLEILQSLSPGERDALARQLGIDLLNSGESSSAVRKAGDQSAGASFDKTAGGAVDPGRLETLRRELALRPDEIVLVEVTHKETADGGSGFTPEVEELDRRLLDDIQRLNPFRLDGSGSLQLPGFRPIAVAGLSEQQAAARIAAEAPLRNLAVKISRLPVNPMGFNALKPFGYELFDEAPSTFAPVTDIPVPADYVIGPGDQLSIQLFGGQNRNIKLTVGRDGRLAFPELGPIALGGMTFETARKDIESRVAAQMLGVKASVSMADTRAIRVFVMGEARQPGAYTVSGLATMTGALFASGGIKTTGSLRDIQLKRQGQIIRRLDLYELLLRGDTSNDVTLLSGDVIFIPPVGPTVSIEGEVRRPAIYELRGPTSLTVFLNLAGGLSEEADSARISVIRIDEFKRRVAVDLPLPLSDSGAAMLRAGDQLRVPRLPPTLDAGVTLEGHFFRPGTVAWRDGLRLSQVVPSVNDLKAGADLNYLVIRRESGPNRRIAVLSADLVEALRAPGSAADPLLSPKDTIIAFDAAASRRPIIDPLLVDLRRQARPGAPSPVVTVGGRVNLPGDYPLEPGMRISDLLRAGGNLQDAAYTDRAELTRSVVTSGERRAELLEVDLAAILRGVNEADIELLPFDSLVIKEIPEWGVSESVTLRGEVRFPGVYPIRRGETLRSVLERAGGLTALAFPGGSFFSRRDLLEREQRQIEQVTTQLKADLASRIVQASNLATGAANSSNGTDALLVAQGLLSELNTARPTGRLVIDLDRVIGGRVGSSSDVILSPGDALFIPKISQEVTVIGEVQSPSSHLYQTALDRDHYLRLSGGITRKGDASRIYIVRADGSIAPASGKWLTRSDGATVQPGDTIVVPVDTTKLPPLPLWQAVSQIIYNAAIAVAAVRSL